MFELLGLLAKALVGKVATDEVLALVDNLARGLVHRAAQRCDPEDQERYDEEWRGILEDTPTSSRRLLRAIGLYIAAARMRREVIRAPQKSRPNRRRIVLPPGSHFAHFAQFFLSSRAYSRYVSPIVADLQSEYFEAIAGNRMRHAAWITVRGYLALLTCLATAVWHSINRWWR